MKPKRLKMIAFGPYGEEQVIDFEKLVDSNIFLIHGPTGAGKTTILDAMCYALYGYTNGGERSAENMRSKFAQPQQGAEVELIFTVHGQDYKVTRSPRFERPKLKGEGTTEQLPKVNLSEWNGEKFITLSEKQTDVDKKINELLRFNIDQFRQVIMIAQNKFRELLTVDSKERQKILQDIFETGIYENIEQKLEQINSTLVEAFKLQQVEYATLLNQIKTKEHGVLKQYIETKVLKNAPQVIHILNEICTDEQENKLKLENELTGLKQNLDEIQEKLIAQTEKYNALIKSKEVKAKLQQLNQQKEYYIQLDQQVRWSEKAVQIMPLEKAVEELKAKIKEKQADITKTALQLTDVKKQVEVLQEHKEHLDKQLPEVEQLKKEHGILETYLPRVEELAINQTEQVKLEQQITNEQQVIQEKRLQIQNANEYILKAERAIETKEVFTRELNEKKLYSQKIEQVLGINQDIAIKQKHLEEARMKYSQLSKEIQGLRQQELLLAQTYDELFNKWLTNQAGEIAKVLEENKPCPVCGATNHPAKATITHTNVDLEEIRKTEADKLQLNGSIKQKQEEQNNIKETGIRLAGELEILKAKAKELIRSYETIKQVDLEQVIESITGLEQQIDKINKDQKQMQIYKQKLAVFEEEKERLEELLKQQQIKSSQIITKIETVQKELPKNLQSKEALEAQLQYIAKQYKHIESEILKVNQSFESVKEEYAKLQAGLEEKNNQSNTLLIEQQQKMSEFNQALEELGFKEQAIYQEAKGLINQIQTLKQQIEEYTTNKIVLENTLKDIEIQITGFNEEELIQTKAVYQEYTKQREAYQISYNKTTDYITRHQSIMQQIQALYEKSMESIRKQSILGKVTGLAKGKNVKGISFETYIQSSIFEQVLNSANTRLKPMTSSRYELYREEDRQDKRKRAGLDIAVKDNYVGQTRPVNTLSGGESFMAALALALGLSDVISRLAGATALDTMFIDEGFGTLDEEALELAIKTLLNLGDTGRLVGIISHVKELKEQIPARLEIVATNTGSKAEFKM